MQLPSALPYIATGLRISSAIALIVAVTAELVAGNTGLGDSIALAQSAGQTEEMYALIVTAGILGVIVHVVFAAFERRLLHWHQSQRAGWRDERLCVRARGRGPAAPPGWASRSAPRR